MHSGRSLLHWFIRVPLKLFEIHDDVIKSKHFLRYWSFVRGIHRSPLNSPRKGQWRGALMFSLIGSWINDWVNNREAGDLRRHRVHYDFTVMLRIYVFSVRTNLIVLMSSWDITNIHLKQFLNHITFRCSSMCRDYFTVHFEKLLWFQFCNSQYNVSMFNVCKLMNSILSFSC